MKWIDIFNNVAENKHVPQKIKYDGLVWDFDSMVGEYFTYDTNEWLTLTYGGNRSFRGLLNDDVQIIEENKNIEPLKIEQDAPGNNYYIRNEYGTKCGLTKHSKMIAEKVNELVREINKMKKD